MNSTIHHLVSTGTAGGFECRTSTDCVCVICIYFPRLEQRPVLSPSRLQCVKSSWYGVLAAVNLSLTHATSVFTTTKVYGYKMCGPLT